MPLSFYTTLSQAIDDVQQTIPVVSVTGMPSAGVISIGNEIIQYNDIDLSNPLLPVLTSCVRGFAGTSAVNHLEGIQVNLVGLTYPASVQSREDLFIATNNFRTTIPSYVGAGQVDIPVLSVKGLPPSGMVSIDEEIIFYAFIDESGANPVLRNCIRGFDGTGSNQHGANSIVEVRWVAKHHNILAEAILLLQSVLGVNPAGSYPELTTRLERSLPHLMVWSADGPSEPGIPNSSVTIQLRHDKRRAVGVQLWRKSAAGVYDKFEAPLQQTISTVDSSLVKFIMILSNGQHEEGYAVII